jgi:hypothetical protein
VNDARKTVLKEAAEAMCVYCRSAANPEDHAGGWVAHSAGRHLVTGKWVHTVDSKFDACVMECKAAPIQELLERP